MRRLSQSRKAKSRRGAATVELALICPILVTVVLGIVEFGQAMLTDTVLTNASREGARLGTLAGYSSNDVRNYVAESVAGSLQISEETVTVVVTVTPASGNPNADDTLDASKRDLVTVQVSVPFNDVSLTAGRYLAGLNLSATSSMRHQ